mgnify:CR=1 FL=1
MILSLSIKNYALIDSLNVDFNDGFSIITGETGAGKSILLGGFLAGFLIVLYLVFIKLYRKMLV